MRWLLRRPVLPLSLVVAAFPAAAAAGGACSSTSCSRQRGRKLDDPAVLLQQQLAVGHIGNASPAKEHHAFPARLQERSNGTAPRGLRFPSHGRALPESLLPMNRVHWSQAIMGNSVEFCHRLQIKLQSTFEKTCHTNQKVICVWGDTDVCPVSFWNAVRRNATDHCRDVQKLSWTPLMFRPSYSMKGASSCGYVMENPFLKFNSYSCEVRNVLPVDGAVHCDMSLSPLAILVLVFFWGSVAAIGVLIICLGFRHFRHKGQSAASVPLAWLPPPQQQPIPQSVQRSHLLLAAAQRGDARTVVGALQDGASVDARSRTNATPLISAAQFGHHHVVETLLRADANPNLHTDAGNTAVLLAALRGHLEVVRMLLRWGADPRKSNNQGWCALDVPGVQSVWESVGADGQTLRCGQVSLRSRQR